jgi:translation initiation factor 1
LVQKKIINRYLQLVPGPGSKPAAVERAVQELPPNHTISRVQASKDKGKKTVIIIMVFKLNRETLAKLLKQLLKNQCGHRRYMK